MATWANNTATGNANQFFVNINAPAQPAKENVRFNTHYLVAQSASASFTGRDDVSEELRRSMFEGKPSKQRRFVLYGLGGSGKTQVALKFAEDHQQKYWGIFWIDCSSIESIELGYAEIATECKVAPNDMSSTKRWLSQCPHEWLLIFDNADDPALDLSTHFPAGSWGSVLVTSRNPACKKHNTVGYQEFAGMAPKDAVKLLLRLTDTPENKHEDETVQLHAKAIVELLGYLALAITQASAAICEGQQSLDEFMDIYNERREGLTEIFMQVPSQEHENYKYTVYTTWEICIEMIKKKGTEVAKNALDLLALFSGLHHNNISEGIFSSAWTRQHAEEKESLLKDIRAKWLFDDKGKWNKTSYRKSVALLISFSLIQKDHTGEGVSMHPLVHSWNRSRISEGDRSVWDETAATILAVAAPRSDEGDGSTLGLPLYSHIVECLTWFPLEAKLQQDQVDLKYLSMADAFAIVYFQAGREEQRKVLLELSVKVHMKRYGALDPHTLAVKHRLSQCYHRLGKYIEALQVNQETLQARKVLATRPLLDVWESTCARCEVLGDLGRFEESLTLSKECFNAQKASGFSDDDPKLFVSREMMGQAYHGTRNYSEAQRCQEDNLEIAIKAFKEDDPRTLRSMEKLAYTYPYAGKTDEALQLAQKAYDARKRIQGEEHPDTLASLSTLAFTYFAARKRPDSLRLEKQCLEARVRVLGEDHTETLNTLGNVARSEYLCGNRDEGISQLQKALQGMRNNKALGDDHPTTMEAQQRLRKWLDKRDADSGKQAETMTLNDTVQ